MKKREKLELHPHFVLNFEALVEVYRDHLFTLLHTNPAYEKLEVDDELALSIVGMFLLAFHGMGEAEVLAGVCMYPDARLTMLMGAAAGVSGNPEYEKGSLRLINDEARRVGWSPERVRALGRAVRNLHDAVNGAAPMLRTLQTDIENEDDDEAPEEGIQA